MPLWEGVPACRPRVARSMPEGHYNPLNTGTEGATVIKLPTPPGSLLRGRFDPTPPVHVQEHRVVDAEDRLPLLVEHLHAEDRHVEFEVL